MVETRCPHNKPIEQRKEMGIYFYFHKDDNSLCNLLNSSNVSLERLHRETLKNRKYPLNSTYIKASINNKSVQKYFISELAELPFEELKTTMAEYAGKNLIDPTLLEKLVDEYGWELYLICRLADLLQLHIYNDGYAVQNIGSSFRNKGYYSDVLPCNYDLDNAKLKGLKGLKVEDLLKEEAEDANPES